MAFRPSTSLKSRTFIGLLIAQFLAAFTDQAIHAAAMFFAFHMRLLNEKEAISLMPILFYAPWAIFCTLAGYFADRYSKRNSLVFWKFSEIVICSIALLGFYLGDHYEMKLGPTLVLACVFLMGMHSAFFVPAKYGVMPEILDPQLLSRGNGILESLSFLAVILGTVCGGVLSFVFHGRETWIGVVFLALAIIGSLASLMIEKMPAANPQRKFPPYLYGPLKESLKSLLSARPLALAVVGIAFFTFVVAYMRQAVYMLGESQAPRWNEFKTSLIVGSTALGIGVGSPLAGWLSGRKVELGLVPLGGIGMIVAAALAAASVHWVPGLVLCIIVIGFFTGFYLVPLYTLLQHRAPKSSKGDAVAISNFINVTGAILASFLFFVLVSAFQKAGFAKPIPFGPPKVGRLISVETDEGRVKDFVIDGVGRPNLKPRAPVIWSTERFPPKIDPDEDITVRIAECEYRHRTHILLCRDDETAPVIFDNSGLPAFLFLGAAGITVGILLLLWMVQPDLLQRAAWAFRNLGRVRVRAIGTHHVPLRGPAILATNCQTDSQCRHLRSATDRLIQFVGPVERTPAPTTEQLSQEIHSAWQRHRIVALTEGAINILPTLANAGPIIPTFVGHVGSDTSAAKSRDLRVAFGPPTDSTDPAQVIDAIRETAVAEEDYHGH
jgi:MFS family permease